MARTKKRISKKRKSRRYRKRKQNGGNDKSKAYGLNLKVGTWAGVFKVNNLKVWDEVKAGDYKGISLEGIFSHLKTNLSAVKPITELSDDEASVLLEQIKTIILEAQPSVASSYPGEVASGSISPATL